MPHHPGIWWLKHPLSGLQRSCLRWQAPRAGPSSREICRLTSSAYTKSHSTTKKYREQVEGTQSDTFLTGKDRRLTSSAHTQASSRTPSNLQRHFPQGKDCRLTHGKMHRPAHNLLRHFPQGKDCRLTHGNGAPEVFKGVKPQDRHRTQAE